MNLTAAQHINNLHIREDNQPIYPTNIFDILAWCRDYDRNNKYPVNTLTRFCIGHYQIHQGMAWKDGGVNKYESFAAATLHFFMVSEKLKLGVEDYQGEYVLNHMRLRWINWEEMCYNLSASVQMLFYSPDRNKTKRAAKRYNKDRLAERLSHVAFDLIKAIPPDMRSECYEKATTIMTKELK